MTTTSASLMAEKIIARGDQLTARAALNAERMRLFEADLDVLHKRVARLTEPRDLKYAGDHLHDLRDHLRAMSARASACLTLADMMYAALDLAKSDAAEAAEPASVAEPVLAGI